LTTLHEGQILSKKNSFEMLATLLRATATRNQCSTVSSYLGFSGGLE